MYIYIYILYIPLYTAHLLLICSIDGLWSHYLESTSSLHLFTRVPRGWCPAGEATPPAHCDHLTEKYHWNPKVPRLPLEKQYLMWNVHYWCTIHYEEKLLVAMSLLGSYFWHYPVTNSRGVPWKAHHHLDCILTIAENHQVVLQQVMFLESFGEFSEFPLRKRML